MLVDTSSTKTFSKDGFTVKVVATELNNHNFSLKAQAFRAGRLFGESSEVMCKSGLVGLFTPFKDKNINLGSEHVINESIAIAQEGIRLITKK